MKAVNFWKTLFCSALAITAFTACSDNDDDNGYSGMPEITVNGGGSVTVARDFTAGETSPVVEVVSKGDWKLKFENEADAQWCTPTKMSGKTGTTSLSFNLSEPEVKVERQATITLIATSTYEGIELTREATVVVKQNKGGSTEADTNVSEIRALLVAMSPEQTKKPVTAEIAAMSITGIIVSDYAGGNMGSTVYVAVQDSQIAPNSGLSLVSSKFTDLKLPAGTVVTASLSGAQVGTYGEVIQLSLDNAAEIEHTAGAAPQPVVITVDKIIDYESMLVKIEECQPIASIVGKKWTDVYNTGTMEVKNGGATFNITTAKSATFKDDIIPDKSGYVQGIASQWLGAPQLRPRSAADIVLDKDRFTVTVDYTKATINQINAAGNYEVDAVIVGVHSKGVMFADNAGGKNNFILAFNNNWKEQISNPYKGDVGKNAVVKGAVKDQHGLWQFDAPEDITVKGAVSFNLGTPANFDAAGIEAYASAIKADEKAAEYKYVKLTGTLTIEHVTTVTPNYNSYTLAVPGLSANVVKTVTMAYGFDSYYTGIASGNPVDVEGFALGFDTTKDNLNIMVTKVTKNTSTPTVTITTTPTTFAAASPQQQTLAYTVANTSASQVTFSIEGTNADKFTVVSKTDAQVVVKANGDNTTSAAYTANLVAKVDGTTSAIVELKQAAKSGSDTKGNYESMAGMVPTADNSADAYYAAEITTPGGKVNGIKFGTSSKAGFFTTKAIDATGNKKLSFYAVAWKGKSATIYVRVNNGGSVAPTSSALTANDGATGNPPFAAITFNDETDYYTFDLTGLTAASTLTFSTDASFSAASNSNGRAVMCGIQVY